MATTPAAGGTGPQATLIDAEDPDQLAAARALVVRQLTDAHATEQALVTTLQAHGTMTPPGAYRRLLERHLAETRRQARAIERRLEELGASGSLVAAAHDLLQTVVGQALALAKGPIDLLRGPSREEKLLRNARDECASEAFEIAIYDALEAAARAVGDEQTEHLAGRHREQEERMLADLRAEIPRLAAAAVVARSGGQPDYGAPGTEGAAPAAGEGAPTRDG